ncbi:MAG: hypothetical protein IPL52_17805 [Flavobacteriales bacterium]|nr:hypothetical protein [Flavobacteriales bacterium]
MVSTIRTTVSFSQPATITDSALHLFTLPPYPLNYPPANPGVPAGVNCSVCPAVFTTTMCAGQYFTYYMCIGNAYTISMCGATTTWDSYLAITTTQRDHARHRQYRFR